MAQASLHRRCSECGNQLGGNPKQVTCGPKCRADRSRRLKRAKKRFTGATGPLSDGTDALQQMVRLDDEVIPDAAMDVIQQEIRPVVREALTEDVLRSIRDLIALTPTMVKAIHADLLSPDDVVRQKAYSLLMRYTVGHPAVIQADQDSAGNQLVVVFDGMVRPPTADTEAQGTESPDDAEEVPALIERTCQDCGETKSISEFVGLSDRCTICHEGWRAKGAAFLTTDQAAGSTLAEHPSGHADQQHDHREQKVDEASGLGHNTKE